MSPSNAAQVGEQIRGREAEMYRSAVEMFPGDDWSQGDHFSNQERRFVREQSNKFQTCPGSILKAIADDVRAHPTAVVDGQRALPDRGTAPPCVPRPFYE